MFVERLGKTEIYSFAALCGNDVNVGTENVLLLFALLTCAV